MVVFFLLAELLKHGQTRLKHPLKSLQASLGPGPPGDFLGLPRTFEPKHNHNLHLFPSGWQLGTAAQAHTQHVATILLNKPCNRIQRHGLHSPCCGCGPLPRYSSFSIATPGRNSRNSLQSITSYSTCRRNANAAVCLRNRIAAAAIKCPQRENICSAQASQCRRRLDQQHNHQGLCLLRAGDGRSQRRARQRGSS